MSLGANKTNIKTTKDNLIIQLCFKDGIIHSLSNWYKQWLWQAVEDSQLKNSNYKQKKKTQFL